MAAVTKDGELFRLASNRLQDDVGIIEAAIGNRPSMTTEVRKELLNDNVLIHKALARNAGVADFVNKEWKKDKKLVLELLKKNGSLLSKLDEPDREDRDTVLLAMANDPTAFKFAGDNLKKDKQFVMKAIELRLDNYHYIDPDLKDDKDFTEQLITKYGTPKVSTYNTNCFELLLFGYLNDEVKNDPAIFIAQLKHLPIQHDLRIAGYLPMITNKNVALEAVKRSVQLGYNIKSELLIDNDFLKELLNINCNILQFVGRTSDNWPKEITNFKNSINPLTKVID